jgi:hypothetical protein
MTTPAATSLLSDDIRGTEDVEAMVEAMQTHLMVIATYAAMQAAKLEIAIERQLKKEGLGTEGPKAWLMGGTTRQAAGKTVQPLNHVADALTEVVQAWMLFGKRWAQNVAEPIAQARATADDESADFLTV